MADEDRRRCWIADQRLGGGHCMLGMDEIGSFTEITQVVDGDDALSGDLPGDVAEQRRIDDRAVPTAQETTGEVAQGHLRAAPVRKPDIGSFLWEG